MSERHEEALDAQLKAHLDALPPSIEPQRDLWKSGSGTRGIAARVEASRAARARSRRIRAVMLGGLAAAAAIAMTVTAVRMRRTSAPAMVASASRVEPAIVAEPKAALLPEEESYRAAVRSLEASLAGVQSGLPPKSAEAVTRDLRTMDAAIEATRTALAKTPEDPDLRDALRDAYQHEIDVLSDVIVLCTST